MQGQVETIYQNPKGALYTLSINIYSLLGARIVNNLISPPTNNRNRLITLLE